MQAQCERISYRYAGGRNVARYLEFADGSAEVLGLALRRQRQDLQFGWGTADRNLIGGYAAVHALQEWPGQSGSDCPIGRGQRADLRGQRRFRRQGEIACLHRRESAMPGQHHEGVTFDRLFATLGLFGKIVEREIAALERWQSIHRCDDSWP